MTTALIKFAPIFTVDRLNDPVWNRPGRTLYEAGSLTFVTGQDTCPLIVDHEDELEIGTVHDLFKMDWTDGPWICARATVSALPCWLKRGTRASFDCRIIHRRDYTLMPNLEAEIMARAFVKEVSVLSASKQPKKPRAEVLSLRDSPAAVPTSDRSVAGETDEYRPQLWDELERVVGYRVTDANFERAVAQAQRRLTDRVYDDAMAARHVIVRRGVGQVLGVR